MQQNGEYTLGDVKEVFRFLSHRSLQTWVTRKVIIPAQKSQGKGFAVKFDYRNLIEIGLIMQLVKFGFDRYTLLKEIMREGRAGGIRWVGTDPEDEASFDGCFVASEADLFAPPTREHLNRERLGFTDRKTVQAMFNAPFSTGAVVVDILAIKVHVDKMLRNYVDPQRSE